MTPRELAARVSRSEAWSIGLVCLGLRVVSLARACLSDDEAIYAVVAREMLAGRMLYRDVVDHKPPLIYFLYALTQAIGGARGGMLLLHLLTIGAVLATALLLRRMVREFAGVPPGSQAPRWAALLYAVFTTTLLPFDGLAANCELFMMLPLTASVLFFLRGSRDLQPRSLLVSGALLGVAALCKYQAGIQGALYGLSLIATHRRRMPRALLASAAVAAGVGAVVVAALVLLHGLGCLEAAWFWFRFNVSYIKTGFAPLDTVERAGVRVAFVAGAAAFLWILGLAAALKSLGPSPGLTFPRFAALWALASALAITTGGRFFGHYFHQITAPLAVLAAPAAARLWRAPRAATRRLVMAAVGGPAAAFFLLGVFQTPVLAAAGQPAPDYRSMADLVRTHARPGDSLVVWGNLPVLYFVAERPLGTRFVFSNYMTGLSPATPSQSDPAVDASPNIVPESWAMFEADLAQRKPRLLIDTSPGNVAAYGKFPPSNFPRLQALLDRDYHGVASAAGVRLLVRREGIRLMGRPASAMPRATGTADAPPARATRLDRYTGFLARHGLAISIAALVLFALGVAAASRLQLRSDFTELLPEQDPEVAHLKMLGDKIGAPSTLVVAVEGPDPAANERFAEAVVRNLQPLVGTDLRAIDYRADASQPFFAHNRALYANLVDLQRLDDDVRKLVASRKNPMFLPFADPDKGQEDDDPAADLRKLKQQLEARKPRDLFPSGYYESADRRLLAIVTWTASSGTGDASGFRIRDDVQRIIDQTRPASFGEVKAAVTGDVVTAIEEHDALKSDIEWVSLVCTVLVLLVIALYFRSVFALGYVFFPTLLGVAVAFGITALAIGYLNTNTAFLGLIIIGNGINFGIILLARYREERGTAPAEPPEQAMARAMAATLRPTLAAALAAGIAYASLALTSFRGFRQFGFVGGTGMVLCWLATYSYCPALVLLWERRRTQVAPGPRSARRPLVALAGVLLGHRRLLLGVVAAVTVAAGCLVAPLAQSPFEYDFSKLRNQHSRKHGAGELYSRVGKIFPQDISPVGVALLDSPEDAALYDRAVLEKDCRDGLGRASAGQAVDAAGLARECARRVAAGEPTGGLLSSVSTAFDYLPREQEAKLALIANLRAQLDEATLANLSEQDRALVREWMPPADLHPLTPADLPDAIARRFRERDGTVGRVALLFPVRVWANWDGHNLIRLADVTRNVVLPNGHVGSAAGHTSLFAAMLRSIAHDGPIATVAAILGVVLMVLLLFRNLRSSAMVLLSLAVGVLWMGGAGALMHMKLNFLNFVALPITFGIGVDYAVNIFARLASEPRARHAHALAETGSAVALCSSTTIIGYSSLLIASNGALVSFGKLANLGEVGCLLAALLLVPAAVRR